TTANVRQAARPTQPDPSASNSSELTRTAADVDRAPEQKADENLRIQIGQLKAQQQALQQQHALEIERERSARRQAEIEIERERSTRRQEETSVVSPSANTNRFLATSERSQPS